MNKSEQHNIQEAFSPMFWITSSHHPLRMNFELKFTDVSSDLNEILQKIARDCILVDNLRIMNKMAW
jgi:hypothetical protein